MNKKRDLQLVACLSGADFEDWVVQLLEKCGLTAQRTGNSDCGVDIIAEYKDGKNIHRFYIQCKFYNKPLGKAPVQEIFAGTAFHRGEGGGKPVVFTNNYMTKDARTYARQLEVEIISKPELDEIKEAARRRMESDPIQHRGLLGILMGVALKSSKYITSALNDVEDAPKDKNELQQLIISEFDEAEECVKEAAYLQQKAARYQQRALDIQKRVMLRNITYG